MSNVVPFRRKPRPLRREYDPEAPYVVERDDEEDGSITYVVVDDRPDSFRNVCMINDDGGRYGYAHHDARQIMQALNHFVRSGQEKLPKHADEALERDAFEDDE